MNQNLSPFKFLDSYQKDDKDIFFGRDKEVVDLYDALSGVKQLLLYGPSGSGKTSVIECGLRNQYSDADWFAITIRRGSNLNESFFTKINESLKQKIALEPASKMPIDTAVNFGKAVEQLFAQRYRPIYLLFDQFEELLILGSDKEKTDFFTGLNQLIQYKLPCRVIFIMREDFIGYLSEFEYLCPSLFQYRFRLEKMGKSNVREVIHNILTAPRYLRSFDVEKTDELCEAILSKLPDNKLEIELAHVQVFLGELWERAIQEKKEDAKPLLCPELIKGTDNLQSVLGGFLKKQFDELKDTYGENVPLEVLAHMITERNTKLQIDEENLQQGLESDNIQLKSPLTNLLHDLEIRRIIRTTKAGDKTQYEISHDILAQLVGESLTEGMKLRETAQKAYKVYEGRTELFSQNELNFLQPYEQFSPYPPSLKELLGKSEVQIEFDKNEKERQQKKKLRNARIITVTFLVLGILAIGFGRYAYKQKDEADKQKANAETALSNFKNAQAATNILRFNELEARANTILEAGGRPLEILDTMKNIYSMYDTIHAKEWIEIKSKIDSIKNISDSKKN